MVAAGEEQARTRHPVVAVLTRDAADVVGGHGNPFDPSSYVPATWTLPDGTVGSGRVPASAGTKAGAKFDLWLDDEGRVVDRPVSAADATLGGVMVTLSGWLSAFLLLVAAQTALHFWLNRRRDRVWDRQWAHVEPGWHSYRR